MVAGGPDGRPRAAQRLAVPRAWPSQASSFTLGETEVCVGGRVWPEPHCELGQTDGLAGNTETRRTSPLHPWRRSVPRPQVRKPLHSQRPVSPTLRVRVSSAPGSAPPRSAAVPVAAGLGWTNQDFCPEGSLTQLVCLCPQSQEHSARICGTLVLVLLGTD